MNWESLPYNIIEKIVYYAADKETHEAFLNLQEQRSIMISDGDDLNHKWLLFIRKLGLVCDGWRNSIFLSNKLFPLSRSVVKFTSRQETYYDAKAITRSGYFCMVKSLTIDNCSLRDLRLIYNNAKDNSLVELNLFIDNTWNSESFDVLMDIISLSTKLSKFYIRFKMCVMKPSIFKLPNTYCQEWAVKFWKLMLKTIHCNPLPKDISWYITLWDTTEIDWSFVSKSDCSGVGTVKDLALGINGKTALDGPDWTCLTDVVKVDEVNLSGIDEVHRRFLSTLKAEKLTITVRGFYQKVVKLILPINLRKV